MLRIGDKAPDFEVRLHNGLRFRLSDQLGERNVILYFYPKNFTWGCTVEGCLFTDHIEAIRAMGAEIIGINNDSIESHRQFVRKYDFAFPLACDPTLEVCRNYRALWLNGLAIRRVTYIIDKRGIVRGKAHYELLIKKHWDSVVRTLTQLHEDDQLRVYNRKAWNL